ncbi:MAG: tRNA (adenosine(37)-N6)-threonylcarbamoyltransferase complex ATPase subunit type 1 TsaE [Chloroflexi bacterium]|nr:tRNA (adenosine(37)-N6)-threonylcarbamoyltransferase complex ATPase subunit type 1 TsaE [Chloroflexota bacterium]
MPILDAGAVEFFSNSADQTRRLGIQLGSALKAGDVICLQGDLGAGKTTLVQGLVAGWGSPDPVTSPTFVLINLYGRGDDLQFTHLDAYRLENVAEAEALGIDDLVARGPMVVEWANKIDQVLPQERLWLKMFIVDEERRRVEIAPEGSHYEALLENLQETVFGLA